MTRIIRNTAAVLAILLLAASAASWVACRAADDHAAAGPAAAAKYHCPMHPTVVSDKPGECPICGMDLVLIEPAAAKPAASPSGSGRRILFYRSPMDPSVHSDTPAKDSMGMDFIPVYEDEVGRDAGAIPGRAVVTLSPERRSLLGVRSEAVREARIDRTIRTIGRVAIDERRIAHVHTKFEGYVERLYVDFTGKFVKQGDPLLSIYSPELIATQQEYLLALRARNELGASQIPSVARGGASLLEAAQRAAPSLGHQSGRHRRTRSHRHRPPRLRPARRGQRLRHGEERRAGHARDAGRHDLRDRGPLAGLGAGRRLRDGPPQRPARAAGRA